MPEIEPEDGTCEPAEELSLIGILGEMTAQMAEAVIALVSERTLRDAAREAAVDVLGHIRAKAPGTDPVVAAGLERIVSLLYEGCAR
jgi:hypothetical protein